MPARLYHPLPQARLHPVTPDDHSKLAPLLPIPNRTVKRLRADDSAAPRVKVGHRQALILSPTNPPVLIHWGFFHFGSAWIELFSPCICPMAGQRRATLLACVEKSAVVKIFPLARVCAVLGGFWFFLHGVQAAVPPLFVLNSLDANVSVIDPVTWTETARIATG